MDELIEIWDASGAPTGKTALKSEAHKAGWFHPTVHVWFYTASGNILLQKRAPGKDTFPGLWDVSVAGHIQAAETPLQAARREVREEIGLETESESFHFFGRYKSEHSHPGGILDREFHYGYLAELKVPLASLQPQEGEVSELELRPLLRFSEEVWGMANPGRYVPHSREYYAAVIKAIKLRL
jgi:isopentenyl-diphosphate delta-isomerase